MERTKPAVIRGLSAVLMMFLCACVYAQASPDTRSLGQINGRGWATIPEDARSYFILGMLDGWRQHAVFDVAVTSDQLKALDADRMTFDEAATIVNAGYSDPANVDLPVTWVLMAEIVIKRGDTTSDLAFTALRHLLNKLTTSKNVVFEGDAISPIVALKAVSRH